VAESLDIVNDFDAWAAVSAKLLGRSKGDTEHLLLSLGVAATWPTAEAFWSRTIARDLMTHQLERIRRYADKCAQELERRRKGRSNERMEITEIASAGAIGQAYADFRALGATPRAAAAESVTTARTAPVSVPLRGFPTSEEEARRSPLRGVPDASQRGESMGETVDGGSSYTARMESRAFANVASATLASPGVTMASAGIVVPVRSSPAAPPVVVGAPTPPPAVLAAVALTAAQEFADDAMETQLDGPAGYVRKAWRAADEMLEWPLDKWAALCAELAERPDGTKEIYERHGLMHDESRRHVHGRWEERLQRDPLLAARYHTLLDQERMRLRSR
jgi:hypothetical protein